MRTALVAAIAGAAGGICVLVLLFFIIYFFILRLRSSSNSRSSGTGSSDPSVQAGRGVESSIMSGISGGPRHLTLEELNVATKDFSDDINLIGRGMFGDVYKGLLHDGNFVAVKRRFCPPSQEFIQEVNYLSSIRHRNIVSLLGYLQENNLQMLVYEYVPNGSVATHLFGTSQVLTKKLEFKNRLNIAHGTAKGLHYLHSLNPPLIHMDFKTSNVLVDENFIAKVADAGLKSLLDRVGGSIGPGPSYSIDHPFLDPNVKETGRYIKESDVYSFGIFLVELVTGKEARSNQDIIQLIQNYSESNDISQIVDHRMGGNFTSEGMSQFLRLISSCLDPIFNRRPPMDYLEIEMERISEMEMRLTTVMGEQGTPVVTLGSQIFT